MGKKSIFIMLLIILMTIMVSCGKDSGDAEGKKEDTAVESVTIYSSVRKTGQYPESFVITLSEAAKAGVALKAEDFKLEGNAGMWGSNETRPFTAEFESVKTEGSSVILVPKDFPEKLFYVRSFKVSCSKDDVPSFTDKDVTEIFTAVADDFTTVTKKDGAAFDYHLYTPEKTENMPVVVVFHGYGDTSNLLTYRTAVDWAEPDNQAVRPCYVIAPVIDDDTYYSARESVFRPLKELLDKMTEEGKADPDRIYVMGNSFGGMSSIEFAELYPDTVAGILALCPALNYSPKAVENLDKMKGIPIWFAHAQHDGTIPAQYSQNAVDKLEKLGAKEVRFTEYTDEEMNAAGADSAPDSTYSYHHVELAVMEDDAYKQWLFSLNKQDTGAGGDPFYITPITDEIFERIYGLSFKEDCTLPREDLRYLHVLHKDLDGNEHEGEMIVNVHIAEDVLDILKKLYEADYPIERIRLVDEYGADDEASMQDNNSSSFNFRFVSHTTRISKHGLGLAVDINPLYNPYIKTVDGKRSVEPAGGEPYVDRTADFPFKIDEDDLCFRLFTEKGFEWGGAWKNSKDYQHFEIPSEKIDKWYPGNGN